MMTVAIVCSMLLGLLVFGLGVATSLTRASTDTNFGFSPDPTDRLYKMVRAHGNATEYAPLLAVLILFLGSRDPATWVVWTMGVATAARYLHAAGMILSPTLDKPQPLRFAGALLTYVGGIALCVAGLLSL
ncbi:MAG: MAPEG family protein [Myxococcales bacterium]|nr:MAG: MAPEG family protein [Myxococcales bacterium]